MRRALELKEDYDAGAIHEYFVAFEGGRPAAMGGSVERARRHFARALELAAGRKVSPLVTFAETVSVGAQDRREFLGLLDQALAVDARRLAPEYRQANLAAQRRAAWLKGRVDELFWSRGAFRGRRGRPGCRPLRHAGRRGRGEAMVIKMATLAPEGSAWYKILERMGEDWRKATGGAVTLRIYARRGRRRRGGDDPQDARRAAPGRGRHGARPGVPRKILLRAARPDDVRRRRRVRPRPRAPRPAARAAAGAEGIRRPRLGRRGVDLLFHEVAGHPPRRGHGDEALRRHGRQHGRAALQGDGLQPGPALRDGHPPGPADGADQRLRRDAARRAGLPVVRARPEHDGPQVRAAHRRDDHRQAGLGEDPRGTAAEDPGGLPRRARLSSGTKSAASTPRRWAR